MAEQARPFATEPYYEATLQLLSGEYADLFQSMDYQLAANPDDGWVAFEAGWYQLLVGDKAKGTELLLKARKLINDAELYTMPDCSPAVELAWALQQQGNDTAADLLIQKCQQQLINATKGKIADWHLNYLSARLAVLLKDQDTALQQLELAIEHGWREWWLGHDPVLASLRPNDKFQKLQEHLSLLMAEDKKQALLLFPVKTAQQTDAQHQ